MVEILDLDLRTGGNWNKLPHVALLACEGLVLALERHSGFRGVIEALAVEPDQSKFFAVMVRVAARAVRLTGRTFVFVGVKTRMGIEPAPDFNVTLKALKAAVPGARGDVVT